MQNDRTLFADIKYQYHHGGMTIRLIFINALVFLLIQLASVFSRLIGGDFGVLTLNSLAIIFTLKTDLYGFITQPWGLVTSIFSHFTFWHFLMNMLFLYFTWRIFATFFDQSRLVYTYIIGGVAGGLFELLAHGIFPTLQQESTVIVGASGSIMAIFTALAFYRPHLQISLFGIFPVRLIFLAGFFILTDLFSLGIQDGTAHFAHIGGALVGMLSVKNLSSSKNIIHIVQRYVNYLTNRLQFQRNNASNWKVKKGGKTRSTMHKSDEEYNAEAKFKQDKINSILDKISKSGYDSLSKEEKNYLFNQSKNG
jgi:membrane associated rhomboid family serine protease